MFWTSKSQDKNSSSILMCESDQEFVDVQDQAHNKFGWNTIILIDK